MTLGSPCCAGRLSATASSLTCLRGEPAAAGVWQEFVLWPCRQTRLAHMEGGWKSKREEVSPIFTGAPKTGRAELPHSQTKRKIPCDTGG